MRASVRERPRPKALSVRESVLKRVLRADVVEQVRPLPSDLQRVTGHRVFAVPRAILRDREHKQYERHRASRYQDRLSPLSREPGNQPADPH